MGDRPISKPLEERYIIAATDWLGQFQTAINSGNQSDLSSLLRPDVYWRDVLAFTWKLQTIHEIEPVSSGLIAAAKSLGVSDLEIDPTRTHPQKVTRVGVECIEVFIRYKTKIGVGAGIVRLCPDANNADALKAWTILTSLEELSGFEERTAGNRPTGQSHSRDFRGPNWLDQRNAAVAFDDRDPAVLVVGGGQAGLAIAARLTQLGVDTLIIDKHPNIGDNWRNRYHALTLHNQVQVNHLPYMPFPPNWPTYIAKDKLANWFKSYVDAMELNYWTGAELSEGLYDEAAKSWQATVKRSDGSERILRPRHIVMATGVSGIPNRPKIDTLENFEGPVLHSSEYQDGEDWTGKKAIVIGSGNSGHDISQDLYASGANVTLVQRSPTLIVNIEPSAQLPYALYDEGPPLEDCDLITTSMPVPLARKAHQNFTRTAREIDKPLLDKLEDVGFKLDYGEDETGWQFKYLTRGGGYYFNVGCADLVADKKIDLLQFDQIDHFTSGGASLQDGRKIDADLIILSTGYQQQERLVSKLFGTIISDRVGPIWGFGDGLELRNMYCRTGQPGLWFIAGSLAQCRINSKYLGLQIKAVEEGLLSDK